MVDPRDAFSFLVALEFVVVAAIVLLVVPFDAAAPLVPLCLVLVLALVGYLS